MLYDCPIWEAHIIHTTYKIYVNWLFISVRFVISSRLLVKFGKESKFICGLPPMAQLVKQVRDRLQCRRLGGGVRPGSEDPRRKWQPYSNILARKIPWREAWWATVQRVAKSDTTEQLSTDKHSYMRTFDCGGGKGQCP